MESFPALSPPPGVTSNFIDPPSRKLNLIVLESVFVPLMLQAVLVRIYVRGRITKRWEWDDCKRPRSTSRILFSKSDRTDTCLVAAVETWETQFISAWS